MKIEFHEPAILVMLILAAVWSLSAVLLMSLPSDRERPIAPQSDPAVDVERCRESCDTAHLEMFEVAFNADGSLSECRCSAILESME